MSEHGIVGINPSTSFYVLIERVCINLNFLCRPEFRLFSQFYAKKLTKENFSIRPFQGNIKRNLFCVMSRRERMWREWTFPLMPLSPRHSHFSLSQSAHNFLFKFSHERTFQYEIDEWQTFSFYSSLIPEWKL